MISYTVTFFLSLIIFFVATIWLVIVCIKTKKIKEKIGEKIISGLFSALSFISILCISVPTPTIYPLDDEVRVYDGIIEITIDPNDTSPFIHTYYSLDGSDPKDGYIYEDSFNITASTTVFARNKFLWWWGDISKSAYRFESMQNITVNHADYDLSDRLISVDGLFKGVLLVVISIICLKAVFDGLKSLFRI